MATSLALRSTPEEEKPKRGGRLFGMFRGRQESEHDGAGAPLLGDTDPIPEDEDESLNNGKNKCTEHSMHIAYCLVSLLLSEK